MSTIEVGGLAILKGQRKGRYHLEGGYVMSIEGIAVALICDSKVWVVSIDTLEPMSAEYVTPRGNEVVPTEGEKFIKEVL